MNTQENTTAPTVGQKRLVRRFDVGDIIRLPHYPTVPKGRRRVWQVRGVHLGATEQEGTYALKPLDVSENEPIHVPCLMLETHPQVEKID